MIPADRLTLQRLLDLVERHLGRSLPGQPAAPCRAYAVTRSGAVSLIAFPMVAGPDDADAVAAILALEMARQGCRLFVLVRNDGPAAIRLDGHRIGRSPAHVERTLLIARDGRNITSLHRASRRGRLAGQQHDGRATA